MAAAVNLLTPNLEQIPSLEQLGQQQIVRATLEETEERACQSLILAREFPKRTSPVPFVRLALPDPFEHRQLIPLRILQADECLPDR